MFAQESEEDLRERALELFEQEDYATTSKSYSTLLSINLQSPEYNFRFGACQLFTIEDKEEALKYLKFACEQSNPPPLAYFYYGLGLHLNYQFDRAIAQYEKYKPNAGKKDKEAELVDHYIDQCKHGKTLVSSFTDISVIQRSVLPRTDFYRNYDLSEFGGKIIVKPEDFMSEEDKKRDAKFLMYFQQDADLIYYASYSEKNETGKDLYVIQKLPGGDWSEPKRLDATINTRFDEDYPFIHPEGNVLYFASKGHNSMGGYDIFKSERKGDGSWTKPINMEFAINTPWDDFMFITDLEENAAWFASNRETSNTQVTVYRIGIRRIPLDLTLIKGIFETEGSKRAQITVEDMIQEKTVGVFTSNGQNGEYLLDIQGSGKYKFIVEAEESNAIHTGIVEVPREKGLKQFRQEMNLLNPGGKEQLQIINHFDDPIEDKQLLTADLLRKKASLSVNATEEDIRSSLEILEDGSNSGGKNETASARLDPVAKLAKAKTARNELAAEAKLMDQKAAALYEEVQQNYNAEDPELLAKASIAAELAGIYKKESERRLNAVDQMDELIAQMESSSATDDVINARYTQVAATQNNFKPSDAFDERVENNFEKRLDPTITAYESRSAEVKDLEDDLESINEEIAYYKQEIENTKDDVIKEELQLQIDEAQAALPAKKASLDRAKKELATLVEQQSNAKSYLAMATTLLTEAATKAPAISNSVSGAALNEMQQVLERKAQGNTALLSFLTPELANEAIANELKESRQNQGDAQQEIAKEESSGITQTTPQSVSTSNGNNSDTEVGSNEAKELNAELEQIAAAPSTPTIVKGDLDEYYTSELTEAEQDSDPIIVESNKAELYDEWAENLAVRIDSLEAVKANTEDYILVEELNRKIDTLKQEQAEKESLAMESYAAVASLSDDVAAGKEIGDRSNALSTSTSPESAEQSAQNESSPGSDKAANVPPITEALLVEGELPPSVTTLNQQFDDELMALGNAMGAADPLDYFAARADALKDWANALQDEMTTLGAQINATQDEETKRILQEKAAAVAELRMDKLQEANELQQQVEEEKDQEALALATQSLQEQLSPYVEDYNASAFQQIDEQIRLIPDSAQRTSQLETLYKNWLVGIANEKVKTENRKANSDDPNRVAEFDNKLAALNAQNEDLLFVLDSLNSTNDLAGPAAPSSVRVKGSERFEGYIPIPNESIESYSAEKAASQSELEDANDELNALESSLAQTKKKKEKAEIEETIAQRETEQKRIQMRSSFYAEAEQKIAAVETQLLTLPADAPLPSVKQANLAASLSEEAGTATGLAYQALEKAQAIKKKKEREPAVRKAERLQAEAGILRERADLEAKLAEEMKEIEDEAIETNYIVLPAYEVVLPATRRTLNPNEQADVEKTDEFQFYQQELTEVDSIRALVKNLEQQERQNNEQAQEFMLQAATAPTVNPTGASKVDLTERAYESFEKADALSKEVARLTRQATYMENEANRALLTLPEEAYMNIIAYYNDVPRSLASQPIASVESSSEELVNAAADGVESTINEFESTEPPVVNEDPFALNAPTEDTRPIAVPQDELTNTIFELDEAPTRSTYSQTNPIPVDPPLPSGLMYKVQIGAFRNPIRQDVFKGIAPIIGESTSAGFIRYSAGEFNNFGSADNAKARIQSLGYADAFVVAYYNGQRVSVTQARAMERGEQVQLANVNTNAPITTGGNRPNNPPVKPSIIKQGPIEIRSVENIGGSFYTVQVGVFSKPVTAADIFNITPLQQENLNNGLYRYTTGKFDDINIANRAKDEARALGVSDAFVTAYRDGVRVTVASLGGAGTTTSSNTPTPTPTPEPAPSVSYRISLGTFTDRVPVAVASKILSLSADGIDKVTNPDGTKSYHYGDFSSREAAEQRAATLRSEGITDAQVITP